MSTNPPPPPPPHPHFLQPLLPGFSNNLSIPKAFHNEFLRRTCRRKKMRWVELRSRLRPRRGREVRMVRRRIVDGWSEFCDEHELKVGYILVFSFVGDLRFDVSVFDESECEIEYQQLDEDDVELLDENFVKVSECLAEDQNGRKRNCAEMGVDSSDSYVGTMWPAYLNCLRFPRKFIAANKLNELCSNIIIIKDDRGKVWHVRVRCSKSEPDVFTQSGWGAFVAGNGLRKGDKFEFRIVSKETTPVLSFRRICMEDQDEVVKGAKRRKVVAVRKLDTPECEIEPEMHRVANLDEDEGEEDDEELVDSDRMRRNNGKSREEVPEGSRSSQHVSYFVRTSTQSSIDRSRLFVRKKFARANSLATKCGEITLQNSEGESWVAKLRDESKAHCRFYITSGWKEFAVANGLEAGRVFRLEIVKAETKQLTLKLTKRLTPEDLMNSPETKMDQ